MEEFCNGEGHASLMCTECLSLLMCFDRNVMVPAEFLILMTTTSRQTMILRYMPDYKR